MKKKIISVLAVLAMLVFACGTAFSAEFSIDLKGIKDTIKKDVKNAKSGKSSEGTTGTAKAAAVNTEPNSEDDFDWKVNDDFTEITITGYKGKRTDVIIPATIQDVPVTRIEKCYGSNITSVVIPEGVKEIGKEAFDHCRGLKSVTLPAGICIGYHAFERCEAIETVILGENSTIGECAFEFCESLQSIEIPKGCTLKKGAFSYCRKLESVTLPEGLKIIPDKCFSVCESLANINFPSTLKYIGRHAFGSDESECLLTSVELPEGLEFIGGCAFRSNAITSVSLPKSLKWVTRPYSDCYYYDIISGNNISTITIAEGCAPKAIGGKEGDGRDIIKGASIDKSLKLQKQLAALKLPAVADKFYSGDSKYKKNGSIKVDYNTYYLTDIGKSLYDDLLKYGFTEDEAKNILWNY